MKTVVKRVSRWVAAPTAVLAGLSTHGIAAVIVIVILVAWIISSDARAARLTRIISACRGEARLPTPGATNPSGDCAVPEQAAPPQVSEPEGGPAVGVWEAVAVLRASLGRVLDHRGSTGA